MKRKVQNNHITIETRTIIEDKLNAGNTVTEIAKLLHRDRSNISREISKYAKMIIPSTFGEIKNCNNCINRKGCHLINKNKHTKCDNFKLEICEKLKSSPHVCNGCTTKNGCRKAKLYYKAEEANLQYENTLHSSRKGLHYTEVELNILNNDFYYLVKNTCSIYHSLKVINDIGYNFKQSSIYRQIKQDLLRLKPSDLPRISKKRSGKKEKNRSYKRNIEGHTFEDYVEYKDNNPTAIEWQMDCVQGIQGKDEPVFLTLQIVEIKFLFTFIISRQTADEVTKKLEEFKNNLSPNLFDNILNLLLTDNGHEFINLEGLLSVCSNTNIFYCHPYSSFEKGSIENNHEILRRVIPQGFSLKIYSQDEINILTSHVNSLLREDLDGKCPFDLVDKYIPIEILNKLGLKKIHAKDVCLNPLLLGNKNVENIKKWLSKEDMKKHHISLN